MPKALDVKKGIEEQQKSSAELKYVRSSDDKAASEMFEDRKQYLKEFRTGLGIEEIWRAADKAYIPHKIKTANSKKVLVSDDELGWRSAPINLNSEDEWQETSVPPNPYIKIQTALGIIVDRNPAAVLNPGKRQYENNTLLMKNLFERSWDIAMSKKVMLKPFVFNAAKYGIGIGRTYPLNITRDVRDLKKYVPDDPKKNEYDNVTYTYYDDVFRESLNPWTVWLDDCARVGDPFSSNDVIYFKDYSWLKFKQQFGHLKNFKHIKPTLRVVDDENGIQDYDKGTHEGKSAKYTTRVWFWENLDMDLLFIQTDEGVVLVNEPLPQAPKNKRLSVYSAPWTMRDDKSPYGIGVYEAMRNDQQLYMKIRNMTMDQLVLSIYREFFYTGTESLEGDGQMRTRPGKGRQVADAKNIKWNEIPAPGIEAWDAQDRQMQRIDDVTGISKSLQGEVTGSTAFEISQARESALKRMKTPLEHITDALEVDAYISCGIIEDMYSVAKIKLIADEKYIEPFELDEYRTVDGERLVEGQHYVREMREIPLKLGRNDDGTLTEKENESFFMLKEDDFPWEGVIRIKGQSIIADSELLERTTTVEMANIIIPLFAAQREIVEKPAREIIKAYGKEPEDWLPEAWLTPAVEAGPESMMELFTEAGKEGAEEEAPAEEVNLAGGIKPVVPAGGAAETVSQATDISKG